jgi:hypothetical protein
LDFIFNFFSFPLPVPFQDNLLLKLLDMGEEFLRLGKPDSIHPRIQPHAFYNGKGPGSRLSYIPTRLRLFLMIPIITGL